MRVIFLATLVLIGKFPYFTQIKFSNNKTFLSFGKNALFKNDEPVLWKPA
ncbi:hypothetical protein SAMN04488512_12338 [Sulfitobacter litoralis]|uniref:Uncharacterized protein n=1 Tax=Sulfitobacter litoralis TaxID=335975 RepID=A0ABY0SUK5_9RHOB|nr:hypothetical protein SAMN04488512_12338 [Sulfitobacter litoralis]